MKQNYQDAMTVVRHFGRPDFFITFTCNPNWPEIQNSIFPGKNTNQRPDIVVRVFNIKLKELMKDLVNNQVFGKVEAYIYVVEFQKRGLPHAHILLTLREQDKLQSANCIDGIVSAEIPNPNQMPQLYRLVTEHMIHGPCGSKCMKRVHQELSIAILSSDCLFAKWISTISQKFSREWWIYLHKTNADGKQCSKPSRHG